MPAGGRCAATRIAAVAVWNAGGPALDRRRPRRPFQHASTLPASPSVHRPIDPSTHRFNPRPGPALASLAGVWQGRVWLEGPDDKGGASCPCLRSENRANRHRLSLPIQKGTSFVSLSSSQPSWELPRSFSLAKGWLDKAPSGSRRREEHHPTIYRTRSDLCDDGRTRHRSSDTGHTARASRVGAARHGRHESHSQGPTTTEVEGDGEGHVLGRRN